MREKYFINNNCQLHVVDSYRRKNNAAQKHKTTHTKKNKQVHKKPAAKTTICI